jgi:hypothetical protein
MAENDIYIVHEENGGWTVMEAEGSNFKKFGHKYHEAIRFGKRNALDKSKDLMVNYKDGRTGRYYYKYRDGELKQTA